MYLTNSVVAVAWTYMFQAFVVFVFLSLFMAVFMTRFDIVVKERGGYPEDFEGINKWKYSDYLLWVVQQWTPESFQKKLRTKLPEKPQIPEKTEDTLEDIV